MPIYEYRGTRPSLGKDVFIAPTASVIGRVSLGDASSVWFGCTLRGDVMSITIGARTNIQDGSVIHVTTDRAATLIGDDVTVGHMALLHGCTVGSRVLVGMGSIVLDGAVIEDDAVVGAGSLVTPGVRIPSGSLAMGRPAKVVRTLTDEDRLMVKVAAEAYVESSAIFRSDAVRLVE
jgi:carbonic anhydrase/acetyltransferase-like protein (isoleucine patch superfamily)